MVKTSSWDDAPVPPRHESIPYRRRRFGAAFSDAGPRRVEHSPVGVLALTFAKRHALRVRFALYSAAPYCWTVSETVGQPQEIFGVFSRPFPRGTRFSLPLILSRRLAFEECRDRTAQGIVFQIRPNDPVTFVRRLRRCS